MDIMVRCYIHSLSLSLSLVHKLYNSVQKLITKTFHGHYVRSVYFTDGKLLAEN